MARLKKFFYRAQKIGKCLSCNLCNQLLTDATKIIECFHTFCKDCIYTKIREEELKYCPVCNIYLGETPFTKIRKDNNIQEIRNHLFPVGNENEGRESLPAVLLHASVTRRPAKVHKGEPIFGDASMFPQTLFFDYLPANYEKWTFKLNASQIQKGSPPLPQITLCYAQMRELSVPISYIYKFLKKKLHLQSEDEVEITCMGKRVTPTTTTNELVRFWLTTNKKNDGTKVAHLNYGWKVASPSS